MGVCLDECISAGKCMCVFVRYVHALASHAQAHAHSQALVFVFARPVTRALFSSVLERKHHLASVKQTVIICVFLMRKVSYELYVNVFAFDFF